MFVDSDNGTLAELSLFTLVGGSSSLSLSVMFSVSFFELPVEVASSLFPDLGVKRLPFNFKSNLDQIALTLRILTYYGFDCDSLKKNTYVYV